MNDIKKLLAVSTLAGFFVIIAVLFFVQIPTANLDLAKTLIIALISIVSAVGGYYFGSSEGSARKTELLSPPADPLPAVVAAPAADAAQAGFIARGLLMPLFASCLLGLLMISACATTTAGTQITDKDTPLPTAGKSLLAVKSTIVTAATATDSLCKAGALKPDTCTAAKTAYEVAKPAYDTAVDAYLLMSSGGGDAANFGAALLRVQNLAAHLLQLSDPLGSAQ